MEGISMKLNNFSIEFNTFVNKRYQDKKIFKYEYNHCFKNFYIYKHLLQKCIYKILHER